MLIGSERGSESERKSVGDASRGRDWSRLLNWCRTLRNAHDDEHGVPINTARMRCG